MRKITLLCLMSFCMHITALQHTIEVTHKITVHGSTKTTAKVPNITNNHDMTVEYNNQTDEYSCNFQPKIPVVPIKSIAIISPKEPGIQFEGQDFSFIVTKIIHLMQTGIRSLKKEQIDDPTQLVSKTYVLNI